MKKLISLTFVLLFALSMIPGRVEAKVKLMGPGEARWCADDLDDEWCCYDCGYGCIVVADKQVK